MAIQAGLGSRLRCVPVVSQFGVPVVSQCKRIVLFACPSVPVDQRGTRVAHRGVEG
jgi:hypothetical protein